MINTEERRARLQQLSDRFIAVAEELRAFQLESDMDAVWKLVADARADAWLGFHHLEKALVLLRQDVQRRAQLDFKRSG